MGNYSKYRLPLLILGVILQSLGLVMLVSYLFRTVASINLTILTFMQFIVPAIVIVVNYGIVKYIGSERIYPTDPSLVEWIMPVLGGIIGLVIFFAPGLGGSVLSSSIDASLFGSIADSISNIVRILELLTGIIILGIVYMGVSSIRSELPALSGTVALLFGGIAISSFFDITIPGLSARASATSSEITSSWIGIFLIFALTFSVMLITILYERKKYEQ